MAIALVFFDFNAKISLVASRTIPRVVDIVTDESFTRELGRAASISQKIQGEAHYIAYLTEDNRVRVNEAIAGIRELNPLNITIPKEFLEDGHYGHVSPDPSHPDYKHEKGKGGHIEEYGRVLLHVHFHPPKSSTRTRPSPGDIGSLNRIRLQNDVLSELCSSNEDKYIAYINPIMVIGCIVNNNPKNYDVFAFQENADQPINFDEFENEMAQRLNQLLGEDYDPVDYQMAGYGAILKNIGEFMQCMHSIGLHTAQTFEVHDHDHSDLERMKIFNQKFVRKQRM